MWKIILVCAVLVGSGTAAQRKRYVSSASRGNYAPDYGFIDPFEFHQKLTSQILSQQAAQNRALTSVFASEDAAAFAEASNYPDYDELFQEQFARQQAFFDAIRRQSVGSGAYAGNGGYSSGGSYSGGYAPNYASASGTYGPSGIHQSASIYPENPGVPNIVNRFSETSGGGGGNGFQGVSVSSFAGSADVNGKKTGYRGATTTVNDNGKVTTYHVHS